MYAFTIIYTAAKATIAKEKGLEPLADIIMAQETQIPLEETAKSFLSEELEVNNVEDALQGAQDIIAEIISDDANYRKLIREITPKENLDAFISAIMFTQRT